MHICAIGGEVKSPGLVYKYPLQGICNFDKGNNFTKIFIMMKLLTTRLLIFFFLIICFAFKSNAQVTELWGTNSRGGDDYSGRIVKIDATGTTVSQAHGFPATFPGAKPDYTTFREFNGYLYGLAPQGGKFNGGVLFRYSPVTGISERLYDFNPATGNMPLGSLLLYNNKFYGITNAGGSSNIGVIYEFDPVTNIFTKKLDLTATVGGSSTNTFAEFNNKLYAVTTSGGANSSGTIMEYDPTANTCIAKIDLNNVATVGRGCFTGLTLFANNKFYGTIFFNNSERIFEWDPATNIYTIKIVLGQSTGRAFYGRFTSNGTSLYATPTQGPGQFGYGCIVEYNPTTNILITKIAFTSAAGGSSTGSLTFYNNKYYGCYGLGGANSSGGFYEWDPIANSITKSVYSSMAGGQHPGGTITPFNGKLYGTFRDGGVFQKGTVAEWDITLNSLVKKFEFSDNKGADISMKLLAHNGKVYGVTVSGGTNNRGVLFSKDLTTGAYDVLYNFPASAFANDFSTFSALNVFNNKIYGVFNGNLPHIFEWDIATATYSQKYSLTLAGGIGIVGKFLLHTNNKFYGIARSGGAGSFGSVFNWDPVTNVFTNLISMGTSRGTNGGFKAFGTKFYVPASTGGNANGDGTVIEFDPATNTLAFPSNFNSGVGTNPSGEFELLNGKLYTSCIYGGANQYGTITEFVPSTGTLINIFNFDIAGSLNGINPNGMLLAYNDQLFGFASGGGVNNQGTTFKYNPVTNVFTKLEDHLSAGQITSIGNGFITVQSNIVVPVKMNYFNAIKASRNTTLLQWQTATEINNKGFNVQRSTNGINFSNIGWLMGSGNNSQIKNYNFKDVSPEAGKNYYRLQQVDYDGKLTLSDVKVLTFEQPKTSIHIYPNPFNEVLTIINKSGVVGVITVFDNAGRTILSKRIVPGTNAMKMSEQPAGNYVYKIVYRDGTIEAGKLLKQ